MLYGKAQYAREGKEESEQPRHRLDGIALAELVSYIEEFGTSSAESVRAVRPILLETQI